MWLRKHIKALTFDFVGEYRKMILESEIMRSR
jgi:hypothetical protein